MTIKKDDEIKIPVFWVSFFAPFILALLTSLGVLAAAKAEIETKTKRNERDIEILQADKASKDDYKLILDQLRQLNDKLDRHLEK